MSDVINHRARRRLDKREGGQVCCASFVRACVCMKKARGRKGPSREATAARWDIDLDNWIAVDRADTPRCETRTPITGIRFFSTAFRGLLPLVLAAWIEDPWSFTAIHARVLPVYLILECDNCEAKKSRNRDNCDFNWRIVYSIRDNSD